MYTADQALARLVAGNKRFMRGKARFPTVRKEVLAALAKGQKPYATIIGCSDSRVPPELLFDAGFGELCALVDAPASRNARSSGPADRRRHEARRRGLRAHDRAGEVRGLASARRNAAKRARS